MSLRMIGPEGAGSYDRRVTIERAVKPSPRDSVGQPILTFTTAFSRAARYVVLAGRELFAAQQIAAKSEVEFRLRYDSETRMITPDEQWRVRFEDHVYDITASRERTDSGRRNEWSLFAFARAEAAA